MSCRAVAIMAKASSVDIEIRGLNSVLRALRQFPKEAQAELRDEAQKIANNIMAPAYQDAARSVPYWGPKLADGVRAKRDRIPAVNIGYARATYTRGASSNMLRWPTDTGDKGASPAPFSKTDWLKRAKTYKDDAMSAWGDALERVVAKWNRGGVI